MREACPEPSPDCKYANAPGGCFSDIHHLYWPRRLFRGIMEKEFRELPENKERICRRVHEEKHATQPIPTKPTREQMIAAIAISKMKELPNDEDIDLRYRDEP